MSTEYLHDTKNQINLIFDNLKLAIKIIEDDIEFYNHFLELQTRYKQEATIQIAAEKSWIDGQRQALMMLQNNITDILIGLIDNVRL